MPLTLIGFLGSRLGVEILAGIGLFVAGFVYCWSNTPTVDVPAIIRNAESGRDAIWESKLRDKERQHESELAEAISARDQAIPMPADDAELDKLCSQSPTCRDKSRKHK
jgi:hypothetical protein